MALANAAAAAPVIEPVSTVAPIDEAVSLVERVLTVTLPRAADGSLGLQVESDGEGRVVVMAGRKDMLVGDTVTAGDIILAIDGTQVSTIARYEQELTHVYATGVSDAVRLKLLRPPAAFAKPANVAEALAAEACHLRAALGSQAAHLEMLARHEEGLRAQEFELSLRLRAIKVSRRVVGQLRQADEGAYATLQAAAESLGSMAVAAAGAERREGLQEPSIEAAEAAISLSKQKRADAYEGRRSIRGRLYQQEEQIMRTQVVINFDPGHAVDEI